MTNNEAQTDSNECSVFSMTMHVAFAWHAVYVNACVVILMQHPELRQT